MNPHEDDGCSDVDGLIHRAVDWTRMDDNGIPMDLEGVRNLFNLGIEHGSFRYIPRSEPISIAEVRQDWMLDNPAISHWITLDERQEVIASAHIGIGGGMGTRKRLALTLIVHPEYQGRGIGTTLIHIIVSEGLQKTDEIIIYTHPENMAVMALMNRLQYEYRVIGPEPEGGDRRYVVKKLETHPA